MSTPVVATQFTLGSEPVDLDTARRVYLGDSLREIRQDAGLTQAALAKSLLTSVRTIADVEHARRLPARDLLHGWLGRCDALEEFEDLLSLIPVAEVIAL